MGAISIIGVPSSAGSYAAGQEQAPKVLRSAGLVDALSAAGLDVHDEGDLPLQIWRPDRLNPLAQNVSQVAESIQELTERLIRPLTRGDNLLVLGGNCTIAELNPTRNAGDPEAIPRFVASVASVIGGTDS